MQNRVGKLPSPHAGIRGRLPVHTPADPSWEFLVFRCPSSATWGTVFNDQVCGSCKLTQNFNVSRQAKRPSPAANFPNRTRRDPSPTAFSPTASIPSRPFAQGLSPDVLSPVPAEGCPDPSRSSSLCCGRSQTPQGMLPGAVWIGRSGRESRAWLHTTHCRHVSRTWGRFLTHDRVGKWMHAHVWILYIYLGELV